MAAIPPKPSLAERRAFAALLRDMKGLVEQVDEDQ
jgi:hypothetical protein